jgi:hypothetical protein
MRAVSVGGRVWMSASAVRRSRACCLPAHFFAVLLCSALLHCSDTFDKVITVVRNEFAAILKRQALAGR